MGQTLLYNDPMNERPRKNPEEDPFNAWEKQVNHGAVPRVFSFRDLSDKKADIFNPDHKKEELFLVDDKNPKRVHFWLLPTDDQRLTTNAMHALIERDGLDKSENRKTYTMEEVMLFLGIEELFPEDEEPLPVQNPKVRNESYTFDELIDSTNEVLDEISDSGVPVLLTQHGRAHYKLVPVPIANQESLIEEYLNREGSFVERMFEERKLLGYDKE
jgi:hypothetical protein